MATHFDRSAVDALSSFVNGQFHYDLADGQHLKVVAAPLPEHAVIGAAYREADRTLWIVIDISKPESREHLLGLMRFMADLGEFPAMDDVLRGGSPFHLEDVENGDIVLHQHHGS